MLTCTAYQKPTPEYWVGMHVEKAYTLSHNYVTQSFSRIIKKISYRSQFPFECVTTACSGDI